MRFLAFIFCVALVQCPISQVEATIIHVPSDSSTIQGGINGAVAGDTVLLEDKTYTGTGNRDIDFLGKAITVRSESRNPKVCVINCQGIEADPHRGFNFHSGEDSESVLEGIKIVNGYVTFDCGGGISCNGSHPTISNCIFSRNYGYSGGGMSCNASSPTIINCTFKNNWNETNPGGAVLCFNHSSPTLLNCNFRDNAAWLGGGIYGGDSLILINCYFYDNWAYSGGAIYCNNNASLRLTNCMFSKNSSSTVFCSASTGSLINCTFFDNWHPIDLDNNSYLTLNNTVISFSAQGVAIRCDVSSTVNLNYCDVYGNVGGDWVGCISGQDTVPGNICCDPVFCYPDTENYYLAGISCCVGAGCDSLGNPDSTVDIGAFAVGCPPPFPPEPFSLLFPANKAFTPRGVRLDWEDAFDHDSSDQVMYNLYVSTSYNFPADSTTIDSNLLTSECLKTLDYGVHYWKVKAEDKWELIRWSDQIGYFMVTGMHYSSGDFSGDGSLNPGDIVCGINYLFKDGAPPLPLEAGDVNCDGVVDPADVVYLINYLFRNGPLTDCP